MSKTIKMPGRIENTETGNVVALAKHIYDDAKGKKQSVINSEVDTAIEGLNSGKQDVLTFDNAPTEGSNNPVKSGGVYSANLTLSQAIDAILLLIPSAATALNQLADKAFVNSSIATDTATFRGTSAAGLSEQQFLAWANTLEHDLNDYVFWNTVDNVGNTQFKRYKWNGTAWVYEYTLNNSSFTADQWAAINSTITFDLVQKLSALPTASELQIALNAKQDTLTFDNTPTAGSNNPVKSSGLYTAFATVQGLIDALTGRMTDAEGDIATNTWNIATNTADIAILQSVYQALTQSAIVIGALPASGASNTIYRVPGTTSYTDYAWNGSTFVPLATYNNAIDDVPTYNSGNLAKSKGILESFSTLGTTDNVTFQNYIRNVFIIPLTSEKFAWLKSLSENSLKITYIGINSTNFGNSKFAIQLNVPDLSTINARTFNLPDFSRGYIFELEDIQNFGGELANGFRIFVEFNQNIDFSVPSTLISTSGTVFIKAINRAQLALFCNLMHLTDELNVIKGSYVKDIIHNVVGTQYKYLKDANIDYRSLKDVISFDGNLFDRNKVISGYYATNGSYTALANWGAAIIPIPLEAGETYIATPGDNIHIDILSSDDFSFITHISSSVVGGVWNVTTDTSNNTLKFTVPNNVNCCMLASCSMWNISEGNVIINKGTIIRSEKFVVSFRNSSKNYIIVDKSGKGDYTTLTSATDAAPDGSTIIVMPGIYDNEIVVAGKTKTLFIIGVDRDKCIIKNNDGDYAHAPIHIASGLLRNLTVIEEATTAINNGSYAVHADFTPMYNSSLMIENCKLISNVPNTGAIGAGLCGGGTLTIKGCHLKSASGRALYCHDNWREGYDGEQWLVVEDCIIESSSFNQEAIRIQGQGETDVRTFTESQYYIQFVRNRVKGTVGFTNWNQDVTISPEDFQGVMNLRLSDLSWGNSVPVLNAE